MNRRLMIGVVSMAVIAAASVAAFCQSHAASGTVRLNVDVRKNVPGGAVAQVFVDKVMAMEFTDRLVKGAPYSADSVNETVQTLADGNRIVRKETVRVYRDSEGRTRREMKVPGIARIAGSGSGRTDHASTERETITISDPVAGVRYVLDPATRTAFKTPLGQGVGSLITHREAPVQNIVTSNAPGGTIVFEQRIVNSSDSEQTKTEPLGKQTIESLEAEGTRSTYTIPAGQLGNDRPIDIVSERWYSSKLQTALLTTHSDARFGTTTFRLSNVSLAEPARSLFEVPADYTIKEGPARIELREER
ncbi:MAG: hypothetical protein NTZ98_00285 [Acidobacteria bacterium]|jgi:hypothetical protein|nr:hypothetical protein [Acidobacteriota bacterium]